MASGYIVTIKLDPFYQQFLRRQFNINDIVFQFPKGHDLNTRFQAFLSKTPFDYKPIDFKDWSFMLEVPFMEHKNPAVYNYISAEKNRLFKQRVIEYYKDVMHGQIREWYKKGFYRNEVITMLMDDFDLDPKYYDRIEREYRRYLKSEINRRHYQKAKKSRKMLSVKL